MADGLDFESLWRARLMQTSRKRWTVRVAVFTALVLFAVVSVSIVVRVLTRGAVAVYHESRGPGVEPGTYEFAAAGLQRGMTREEVAALPVLAQGEVRMREGPAHHNGVPIAGTVDIIVVEHASDIRLGTRWVAEWIWINYDDEGRAIRFRRGVHGIDQMFASPYDGGEWIDLAPPAE
ncbi:MAG: hypothetical protein ACF8NJ_09955 [Phycisphaerales bacterium JB038]